MKLMTIKFSEYIKIIIRWYNYVMFMFHKYKFCNHYFHISFALIYTLAQHENVQIYSNFSMGNGTKAGNCSRGVVLNDLMVWNGKNWWWLQVNSVGNIEIKSAILKGDSIETKLWILLHVRGILNTTSKLNRMKLLCSSGTT